MRHHVVRASLVVSVLLVAATCVGQDAAPSLRLRMLAAEDARDSSAEGIAPLLEGLRSANVEIQRVGVRALGRFEDPLLVEHIVRMLSAPDASVRAEAANALAQAYQRASSGAAGALIARSALERESHALVRGALLLTLGRLKYTTLDEWRAAEVLISDALFPESPAGSRGVASPAVLMNGLRGLQHLARQAPDKHKLRTGTLERLATLALLPPTGASATGVVRTYQTPTNAASVRIRVLAMQALRLGGADVAAIHGALTDPDAAVRRAGVAPIFMVATAAQSPPPTQLLLEVNMRRTLERDPSAAVRVEALRGYLQQRTLDCSVVVARLADASPHVVLAAIDGLASTCRGKAAVAALTRLASRDAGPERWHARAHALVALAQMEHRAAAPLVRTAARDTNAWLRMYAARALRHVVESTAVREHPDVALLRAMTADPDVNVATAAVEALSASVGHAADPEYLAVLARDDRATATAVEGVPTGYELIVAAVKGLEATSRTDVSIPMIDALDRLTADKRDTSRDPRLAILKWLAAQGDVAVVERVKPYVSDFDPEVAAAAAGLLLARAGIAVKASPARLPRAPLPTDAELDALATTKVVLQMADGGRVTIALLPNEAPLNAWRFVRLAERGFFTGRTIHRVVANFVAQGGSPGANEYSGDGPFSRDEVGMASNADGTVGLSTRGRDTGDGQFYVNINDNTRLDHTYTVFGVVASGRDVVERWMEGDIITKVTVTR